MTIVFFLCSKLGFCYAILPIDKVRLVSWAGLIFSHCIKRDTVSFGSGFA